MRIYAMATVDDEIPAKAVAFMDKAKRDAKPFFLWLNPTRAHVWLYLFLFLPASP